MKELGNYADYIFYLSLVGVVLAVYSALTNSDLWLAPTQWVLVSVGMVVYAGYLKTMK